MYSLLVSYSTLARAAAQHVCRGSAAITQRDANLHLPSSSREVGHRSAAHRWVPDELATKQASVPEAAFTSLPA
jgi:hypothetical protein